MRCTSSCTASAADRFRGTELRFRASETIGCSRKPLGDGVRDHFGRERSHLSEVRITNYLSLNSLPLRLQVVFCLLQLSDQSVDFCNRGGSNLLNERSNLHISFCLRRKFCMSEIANFAFNNQIRG